MSSTIPAATQASHGPLMHLRDFNRLGTQAAEELLRCCLPIERWLDLIVGRRPYQGLDHLLQTAREAARPFTNHELRLALSSHRQALPDGPQPEGDLFGPVLTQVSRLPWPEQQQVTANLRTYEQRFDQPFLIRQAGRSAAEILAKLQTRLTNDPLTERRVMEDQLRQIGLLRLVHRVSQ